MIVPKVVEQQLTANLYKPSLYNLVETTQNGDVVAINSLSGARVLVSKEHARSFIDLLSTKEILIDEESGASISALVDQGFIIPTSHDERRQLRYLQSHSTSSSRDLHLIIFPTEKCNFRCIYCYEDFILGKMPKHVRESLKRFMKSRLSSIDHLAIDWFGGEPLLAFDVMEDLMADLVDAAIDYECRLSGHITTNGYLLTPNIVQKLLDWGTESFQITLDGPIKEHDKRRILLRKVISSESMGTHAKILENIRMLLSYRRPFNLCVRTNYDLDSLPSMDAWLDELCELVGSDPRVRIDFCPIWADPDRIDVSLAMGSEKQRTYSDLLMKATSRGLRTNAPDYIRLGGLVCYAGKANSLAIRSDGRINKCTVALNSDYNQVGRLLPDGNIEIDVDLFSKWTGSGLEEDQVCQNCSMSAACQGNACPLERFENNKRPCPPVKNFRNIFLSMAAVCESSIK